MSAPAMNALSPAPVRMMPRTALSSLAGSNAARKSSQVAVLSALSTFGRLRVMYAIEPFFSYRRFSKVVWTAEEGMVIILCIGERIHRRDAEDAERAHSKVLSLRSLRL